MLETLLAVLSVLLAHCSAQLTVDVIRGEEVLWSYSFPVGFTNPLDWYITPYGNLPPQGQLIGVLYKPTPQLACSPLEPITLCNGTLSNLTRLALVEEYHTCTKEKFANVQTAGYDGLVTFSINDTDIDVTDRVRDKSTGSFFDITGTRFPTIVVSEQFASILAAEVAVSSDGSCPITLVRIRSDVTRQGWIGFCISLAMVFVIVGLPLVTCLCVCACVCCVCIEGRECICCCCCSNNGRYEVNQVQVRVLGDDLVLEQPAFLEDESSFTFESRPIEAAVELESYHRVYESNVEPTARKYQSAIERNMSCPICLECFNENETVHALSCDQHHVFHPDCIERWLEVNNMCPVCRTYVIQHNF